MIDETKFTDKMTATAGVKIVMESLAEAIRGITADPTLKNGQSLADIFGFFPKTNEANKLEAFTAVNLEAATKLLALLVIAVDDLAKKELA